jgi:hypothetical protein
MPGVAVPPEIINWKSEISGAQWRPIKTITSVIHGKSVKRRCGSKTAGSHESCRGLKGTVSEESPDKNTREETKEKPQFACGFYRYVPEG